MPANGGASSGEPHRAPRRIALIDAAALGRIADGEDDGAEAIVEPLLEDFGHAYAVYDGLAHTRAARMEHTTLPCRDMEQAPLDLSASDALVVGAALPGSPQIDRVLRAVEGAAIRPETPVYIIACLACASPSRGASELDALRNRCRHAGLTWGGAVAIGGGDLLAGRLERSPRMGWLRRPASEAVDQLIAVMRSGLTVAEAARLPGFDLDQASAREHGVIEARCPVPRFVYERMRKRTS